MRLWSIHPSFLDVKALVANWREGLLGLSVLKKGGGAYYNHPQLDRFKKTSNPVEYLSNYLHTICDEADYRGYKFDRNKLLERSYTYPKIMVTKGQLYYEYEHFLKKVSVRDIQNFDVYLRNRGRVFANLFFDCVPGDVEYWEKR